MQLRSNRQARPARHWSRAQLLIGLTVVLGIVFVVTALHSVRADRQNIEQATCMFAADASRVLQARARMRVEWATEPLFAAIGGRAPLRLADATQSPAVLAQAAAIVRRCHCAPDLPATLFFRFDLI